MKKTAKTNAMRILERNKVDYAMITYTSEDGKIDGVSVANKIGRNAQVVYKTLIAQSAGNVHYVFVIPVEEELDLKKAARTAGEKKVEMIAVKDITAITGYVRGGCSPIGMKKALPTFVHQAAQQFETIIVSGGQIGLQIEISPQDLIKSAGASYADLTK